ncbi:MAG: hypothetical protein GXP54_03680, partial [Deltaproteobacteria bacterium]|nr:hypothetical protein [Deltaproteobacteria bacterium]
TSYVYPGEKPDLSAFKAWIDWAVAAGLLKLVGIRWALGPVGTESLPRLRAIDVEEFLEEESIPDSVPEPVPVPEPDPPAKPTTPDAPNDVDHAGDDAATTLLDWYSRHPSMESTSLNAMGIESRLESLPDLHEAAFAALLLARGSAQSTVRAVLDAFKGVAMLPVVGKGRLPTDIIDKVIRSNRDPAFIAACEALVHLPRILSAVRKPSDLTLGDEPEGLLWGLYRRLYENAAAPVAPFILCRLLFDAGHLRGDRERAAFVPTYQVRLNAFRIGLADRVRAETFGDLVDAALGLGSMFGPPGFEAPLAVVHEGLGCGFQCNHTASCPIPCLEKSEIGR